ncbi:MAG TPA: hypothetical protein VMI10_19345 [Terriglobales bacterium]|nr:hypothetical protein [Terriglobales bacterium]
MMRGPRWLQIVAAATVAILSLCAPEATAQTSPAERTFHVSKKTIEKVLKQLQPAISGHLPTLEGFVLAGEHPLTQYQRAFYQCNVHVNETSAGSVVRVSANVTAWYKDTSAAHSGYQLLKSNGRLEADLLDQLADQLSSISGPAPAASQEKPAAAAEPKISGSSDLPIVSVPLPAAPDKSDVFSPSTSTAAESAQSRSFTESKPADKKSVDLRIELSGLEDAVRNQSRPKNLVAVKKSGTPVVATASLSGKTLFMADAQDEFELLDYNSDWVHVRISGLSRGWIWRTSLEMPEGISDVPKSVASAAPAAADLFQVSREEMAPFPGDWAPLRGKSVKIISVQKIREDEKGGGASAKLEFAKALLDQSYDELAKSPDLAGLVLIFDSSDGGMIAATLPTIRKWKAGSLSDAAMWHQCYFDPPETFTISSAATGR